MRIKGVEGGKSRGKPIELSPKEKAVEAVKDAVSKLAPEGWTYYCENVNVVDVNAQSMGPRKDGKTFANNTYSAKGDVKIRKHRAEGDRLYPAETKQFVVKFQDKLDNWGMPDIGIGDFQMP